MTWTSNPVSCLRFSASPPGFLGSSTLSLWQRCHSQRKSPGTDSHFHGADLSSETRQWITARPSQLDICSAASLYQSAQQLPYIIRCLYHSCTPKQSFMQGWGSKQPLCCLLFSCPTLFSSFVFLSIKTKKARWQKQTDQRFVFL